MPKFISKPSVVEACGTKPKLIEEFVGRMNNDESRLSIARMKSPCGWVEPGQRPHFDEFTVVLSGMLRVRTESDVIEVRAGQSIVCNAGEWIQYSSPEQDGAEYIAVCLPAFSPQTVNRDSE